MIIDGAPGYSPAFEQFLQDAHDEGEPALDVRWWVGHEKRLLVVTKADGTELSRVEARKVKDIAAAALKLVLANTKETMS